MRFDFVFLKKKQMQPAFITGNYFSRGALFHFYFFIFIWNLIIEETIKKIQKEKELEESLMSGENEN